MKVSVNIQDNGEFSCWIQSKVHTLVCTSHKQQTLPPDNLFSQATVQYLENTVYQFEVRNAKKQPIARFSLLPEITNHGDTVIATIKQGSVEFSAYCELLLN